MTETASPPVRSVTAEEKPQPGALVLLYVKRRATVELMSEEQKPEWACLQWTDGQWHMEGQEEKFGTRLESGVYRLVLKSPGRVRWEMGQEDDMVVLGSKNPPSDPPVASENPPSDPPAMPPMPRARPEKFNEVTDDAWSKHWGIVINTSGVS